MVGDICPAIDTTSTKLLIRGGIVVNADRQQIADVYIEDGIIVAINQNIKVWKYSNIPNWQVYAKSVSSWSQKYFINWIYASFYLTNYFQVDSLNALRHLFRGMINLVIKIYVYIESMNEASYSECRRLKCFAFDVFMDSTIGLKQSFYVQRALYRYTHRIEPLICSTLHLLLELKV